MIRARRRRGTVSPGEFLGRRSTLQRLFSTFPAQWPGIGLLLLRCAVGLSAAAEAVTLFQAGAASSVGTGVVVVLLIACGVSVLSGFLTPLSALVVACCGTAIGMGVVPSSSLDLMDDGLAILMVVSTAIAIALLGPGAYSIDSYLFGRREIVIKRSI